MAGMTYDFTSDDTYHATTPAIVTELVGTGVVSE